jgi:hypothetical protein
MASTRCRWLLEDHMFNTNRTLVLAVGLLAALANGAFAQQPLATYRLGAGWATFGLALPSGAARDGLAVGTAATQTDVKSRWPDGSIKFAVVTSRVASQDNYRITAAPAAAGHARPVWPSASVDFVIGPGRWSAPLPSTLTDVWLDGPLVTEGRAIVTPMMGRIGHLFLRVIYDVRVYADGAARLDVTIENTMDHQWAADLLYDVSISMDGKQVYRHDAVTHKYLARWRTVAWNRPAEAEVRPDFTPFFRSNALPEYLSTVDAPQRSIDAPRFDILQTGDLMVPMNAHGGRPEIAPYPDWTAQYLVHKRKDQRAYVLRHGELAGSFGVHIKEPDGRRFISIDEHPNFWLDRRADPDGRPKQGLTRGLAEPGDNAHQPSLAFVPYLVTGDRFFLDEMKYWANYCLLSTFQDSYSNQRGGSEGLLASNEVRGIGWALRNLADTAAYLPDNDEMKAYFRQKVVNNLVWLDKHAASQATPLGTVFPLRRPEDEQWSPYTWIALWEHMYVAWAIDRAQQLGFSPGTALRDRIVKLQLKLFTSEREGYPRSYAGAYVLAVGTRSGRNVSYFNTIGEVFKITDKYGNFRAFQGYYGPEARLMLQIALRNGWSGAADSLQYLMSSTSAEGVTTIADLNKRSGWAIAGSAPEVTATRR